MRRVQGKRVSRFEQVTLMSNGVESFQVVLVVERVTPAGGVPPNAVSEPKDIVAALVPEPPSEMPLASDWRKIVSWQTAGRHCADPCGAKQSNALNRITARASHDIFCASLHV